MNINLNLYKYFYAVAKYNSYTKAANELLISQPSLSYSVKVLEKQLNNKLFSRNSKGIELTNYGKKLYDKLNIILPELESIACNDDNISGNITLGVRSAYATKILPFYITELSKIYPNMNIDFMILKSEQLIQKLKDGKVDIIIDEYEYYNEFKSVEIGSEIKTIFFTSKANFKNIKVINDDILKENDVYIVSTNNFVKGIMDIYPNINYVSVQSTPILINRVQKDNLIGFTVEELIKDELENGSLIKLDCNVKLPKEKIFLTYLKEMKNNKITVTVDFFKEHCVKDFRN